MLKYVSILIACLIAMSTPVFAQAVECPDLSMLQRAAGYVSLLNLMKVVGATIIGLGILFFFGGIITQIIYHTRVLLEVIGYAASGALIASSLWLQDDSYLVWTVLSGCILFAGTVFATQWIHNIKDIDSKTLSGLFMVVWGAVALYYNMAEVGFLAVMAFMTLLGFSIIVGRLSYAFGFEDEKSIPSGTMAALMLLIGFTIVHLFVPEAPASVQVFKPGVFWVSSFVGFLGLLIMSSKWYTSNNQNYVGMQIITVLLYAGALGIGTTFNINPLAGIAGTFLVFYLAAKPFEIPQRSLTTLGLSMIISGSILYAGWWYGTKHIESATQYLTTQF
jgi:hypothetical protein